MRRLLLLALLFACRGSSEPAPTGSAGSAHVATDRSPKPAHDPRAKDPWASAPPTGDEPPTLGERYRIVQDVCPKVAAPYFYAIAKAGKTSYILGTRHVSVGLEKFPPNVRERLLASRLAVFEVAPDDDSHTKTGGMALAEAVGSADWKHYAELVGSDTAQVMEHGNPETALLSMMVMYENIGSTLDLELQRAAKEAHIATGGLETSAFQDGILEHLLDVRRLRATIEQTKSRREIQEESAKDLRQYCSGADHAPGIDAKERKQMLAAGYTNAELDAVDEELVFSRNRAWIPKLETMFADGDVFVAVGADHLVGDRGVISLLRARGFTITRVAP